MKKLAAFVSAIGIAMILTGVTMIFDGGTALAGDFECRENLEPVMDFARRR